MSARKPKRVSKSKRAEKVLSATTFVRLLIEKVNNRIPRADGVYDRLDTISTLLKTGKGQDAIPLLLQLSDDEVSHEITGKQGENGVTFSEWLSSMADALRRHYATRGPATVTQEEPG